MMCKLDTGHPGHAPLATGVTFLATRAEPITVRELITEKVRGELRKRRAGGPTALAELLPRDTSLDDDETTLIDLAIAGFRTRYAVLADGGLCPSLDEEIRLVSGARFVFVILPHVAPPVILARAA